MTSVSNPILQFNNISLGGKVGGKRGILKLTQTGLGWKSEGGKNEAITPSDIRKANWIRVTPRVFQLNILIKGGANIKFDGFREQDYESIRKFVLENYSQTLEQLELSTKGCNWGEVKVNGPMIQFVSNDNKIGFEFPISEVSQSVINQNNKNELTLEFHHDNTLDFDDESIVEMRFFAPTRPVKEDEQKEKKEKEKKEGQEGENEDEEEEEEEDEEDEDEELTPIEIFQQTIMNKSDMVSNVGKSLVVFSSIQFLTPRGRIDIEMYPTFLKLHGKTHDYKVPYDSISRLFQFDRQDQKHIFFIISLEPPIRQGKTKYAHLVIQFQEEETQLELNLTEELQQKYKDQLLPIMSGNTNSLLYKILKTLTGKKLTTPGNFQSNRKLNSIKCSLKANEGFLYPLERSFFFVHKPPTYIKFEEIQSIEFSRYDAGPTARGGSNRTFDLTINYKNSTSIQFTNILREEYPNLFNYLNEKKLNILNPIQTGGPMLVDDEDDEDDDDYEPSESGSEDDDEESDGSDASESEESEEEKKAKKKQKK
ncbi:hypothetical protein DICPUDRAFT_95110 [Dictyostelium purpureum]|uniref:FACT complex subunit SSRP1 n=1 Tax=Dictyostelium purpureum TaxID=5786 RepID=F0ZSA9_DICPU|nr:uncharacterized protein DICPUDRAFT_95110 [Dictyostelium purpureum]EGC33185.1 hypothetical protein DICPUDRAFT_95110 [Dictyostelium purpureum]|eukprot:XP_003290305.1 hypothetical protein DICPUDRAFT_95110 [Dictyostelium purpureum]